MPPAFSSCLEDYRLVCLLCLWHPEVHHHAQRAHLLAQRLPSFYKAHKGCDLVSIIPDYDSGYIPWLHSLDSTKSPSLLSLASRGVFASFYSDSFDRASSFSKSFIARARMVVPDWIACSLIAVWSSLGTLKLIVDSEAFIAVYIIDTLIGVDCLSSADSHHA